MTHSATLTPAPFGMKFPDPRDILRAALTALRTRNANYKQRLIIEGLDAHTLRDIGLDADIAKPRANVKDMQTFAFSIR